MRAGQGGLLDGVISPAMWLTVTCHGQPLETTAPPATPRTPGLPRTHTSFRLADVDAVCEVGSQIVGVWLSRKVGEDGSLLRRCEILSLFEDEEPESGPLKGNDETMRHGGRPHLRR